MASVDNFIMQRKVTPFLQALSDCRQTAESEYHELVQEMTRINPQKAARLNRAMAQHNTRQSAEMIVNTEQRTSLALGQNRL